MAYSDKTVNIVFGAVVGSGELCIDRSYGLKTKTPIGTGSIVVLSEGDTIYMSSGAAGARFPDGSIVKLTADKRHTVKFQEPGPGLLKLMVGEIWLLITTGGDGIVTPDAITGVEG